MFASRRSPLFWRRRRSQYRIGATAGLAALSAAATAAAVYFFDPQSGKRRRALLREQAISAGVRGRELASKIRFGRSEGVFIEKTIHVYASHDEAYSCWRNLEDFPRFMSHVREVTRLDASHYHWKVDGPAGVPVEWDAVITADVPGELIAWRTVENSAVHSAGVVQFEPASYGRTRVHVRLSYRPPVNRVGHTVAKIFGRDPQRQIDDDLARFKSFVETGRSARDESQRDNAAGAELRH
jgi:uncharacterized membrane protein